MVNVYGLYVGAFDNPQRRAAVLAYWRTLCRPSRELTALIHGFTTGFRGRYRHLLRWLYDESLKLSEALTAHVTHTLEGEGCGSEIHGQVPFSFTPRTYLLVDPFCQDQVTQALETMRHKAGTFVTTEKALKLYLYHRNPWEYYLLQTHSSHFPLLPPPEEALRQSVRFALHKEVPRSAGFSIGKTVDRSATVGPQYAQYRLYEEQGKIAKGGEDLRQQYHHGYGAWPYRGEASRDVYFLHDYPVVCQMIEALSHSSASASSFEKEALPT
jgi:hypothetical protein